MPNPHLFEFNGTFELPLTVEETWDELERTDQYETWWPWMRKLEVVGDPLDPGTTFSFLIVAPIPFTMRLKAEVTRAQPPCKIEAAVSGDLTGKASMTFERAGSRQVTATIWWEVEVTRSSLRSVARATRPILLWGQRWAVDIALRGFRRHLAAA
ncbi:MAG: hypothetical protein M3198_11240 [Actinomycetota bacterium]|nr:hypothetical protein [Actinomycetota bacterium]